jgi:hypothetical protein
MVDFSSLFWVGQPSFDGNHDLAGDAERIVDEPMLLLRKGAFPNLEKLTTGRRQNCSDNLVGGELFAQGRPRGMNLFTALDLLSLRSEKSARDGLPPSGCCNRPQRLSPGTIEAAPRGPLK